MMQEPAKMPRLIRNTKSTGRTIFIPASACPTTKLSDAGGPVRPGCHCGWAARIRSSGFVRPLHLFIPTSNTDVVVFKLHQWSAEEVSD
jgi:hypothetical protein